MSKKINELDAATDAEAKNDSRMFANADPLSGEAKSMTTAQAKSVFQTFALPYTGLGTEGKTLSLSQLLGMNVLLIARGVGLIYERTSVGDPESDEFKWDDSDITLGADVNLGEKFLILFKNY